MILLTGSNSYMGEKLLAQLRSEGETVRCLDFYRPAGMPAKSDFIETDLLDDIVLAKACKGVDTVFHFLDISRPGRYKRSYMKKVNVAGTIKLLAAAQKAGVKKFFFLSSFMVFGKVKKIPSRQDDIKRPSTPLGRDKLRCEQMCWMYSKQNKMAITILRPALITGPEIKDPVILTTLYMALAMDEESRLYLSGDGTNRFQLLHPDDAVRAFMLAYKSDKSKGKAYNIGADNVLTQIEQVVKMKEQSQLDCPIIIISPFKLFMWSIIGRPLHLRYFTSDHRFYLKRNMLLDTQLIKDDLGWMPVKDNLEILKETINWYLTRHEIKK